MLDVAEGVRPVEECVHLDELPREAGTECRADIAGRKKIPRAPEPLVPARVVAVLRVMESDIHEPREG
jgi:hypothetical protein